MTRGAAIRLAVLLLGLILAYAAWSPGVETTGGRFDRGRNGLWLAHGWLGGPDWFVLNDKPRDQYHSPKALERLAHTCRDNGITVVYPHLCPATSTGALPDLDAGRIAPLAAALPGVSILPWVGGVHQRDCVLDSARWRDAFASNVADLLMRHPQLGGIHLNIEPMPDGNANFLVLLEELKRRLPAGRRLSVAAYPPPTRWQPRPEVHWSEGYFREVARRTDQVVPMMYDTSIRVPKAYVSVMRRWTREVVEWAGPTEILLGVPAYEDAGVGYHHPHVESLGHALSGINAGLTGLGSSTGGFAGIAVYADWTTTETEWAAFRRQFRGR